MTNGRKRNSTRANTNRAKSIPRRKIRSCSRNIANTSRSALRNSRSSGARIKGLAGIPLWPLDFYKTEAPVGHEAVALDVFIGDGPDGAARSREHEFFNGDAFDGNSEQ